MGSMMFKKTLLGLAALTTTACATTTVPIAAPFDAQDAARIFEEGSNTITGSAVLRMRNGGAQTCAALPVLMVPATRYASERIAAIYGNSRRGYNPASFGRNPQFDPDVPDYARHTRQEICDAQGEFSFDQVADGSYFVIARVTWEIPGNYFLEGGNVMAFVEVSGGETERVILTN